MIDMHSLCSVMSHVVLFAYRMLIISTRKRFTKILPKTYAVNLSDLCNAINNILDKISCHSRFTQLSCQQAVNNLLTN